MPAHVVHVQLAQSLLDQSNGPRRPGWANEPDEVNALYHGAIGPDMGYFPGADGLLSGLAHYVRPVSLTRAILERAETSTQKAFAWGWLTHVLADAGVHKAVNKAAGLIEFGSLEHPSTPSDSQAIHTMVEVGLDAKRMATSPGSEKIRLAPVFDTDSIRFLAEAFDATYGLGVNPGDFLRAHRAVTRYQPVLFRLTWFLSRRHAGKAGLIDLLFLPALLATRGFTRLFLRDSVAFGATHPIAPPSWLEAELEVVKRTFADDFYECLESGLSKLSEVNLDTGSPEDPDKPYRLAEETRRQLAARLGRK